MALISIAKNVEKDKWWDVLVHVGQACGEVELVRAYQRTPPRGIERLYYAQHWRYILFCVHFQTNSSLVWKIIQNFDDSFSKPIPVWFGKKLQFWRLVFQTNSSLVWKKWPLFRNKKFQTNFTFLWKNVKKYIFFSFFQIWNYLLL